jgi:hypothetical protein
MMGNLEQFQKLGQDSMDRAMRAFGDWSKGWQAIAAEMTDYSRRSFEQGTAALEKLLAAKSMEQALEIQTTYARRAYEDYVQQMTKLGTLYSDMARDAYRPVEKMMQGSR